MTETSVKNPVAGRIRLTRIQRLIGERMMMSKQSKPCFYIESKADVTELMGLRPKLRRSLGVKVTSNAFLVRALGLAARRFPVMLGRFGAAGIEIAEHVNVGFAVNSPQGLVVPVVRDADRKTLAEIAREDEQFTFRARSNKLELTDIEGETIALSNLGAYGTDSFLGIVPPPASTILSVGNVVNSVVPMDGEAAARKLMSLSLAVDRRVVGEVYSSEFLCYLVAQLESPRRLI